MENQEYAEQPGWTLLQEAYVAKLMATYQANLYFFKERFPVLFDKIMEAPLAAPFQVGPEGDVEIYSGRFKGGLREYTDLHRMLFRHFDDVETRPEINVTTSYLDDAIQVTGHGSNPDFYRHLEPRFRGELLDHFQALVPGADERFTRTDFGKRRLPMALVFGSGFGWHLDRLVDEYEIRNLIIVDTDIERLNLSLYFVDYVALYQRFLKAGHMLLIGYDEDISRLAEGMLSMIQQNCPPYYVQGAGLFFQNYDSATVKELWNFLRRDLWKLYRGWGFLDDEILGLKQAVENVSDRVPLFTGKAEGLPDDAVAFIVGAGPSLDGLLPLLRKYRDRAVVFSCGSASSAMSVAQIKPDFHVEIERTQVTYRILSQPLYRDWLKDVPIVASVIMAPDVYTLTNEPLMFLKEMDLGSEVVDFAKEFPRVRTNPTCTNGGIELALRLGFKQVYLFGVDLGFRNPAYHHSKGSQYYSDAEKSDELQTIVATAHRSHAEGKPVPANFGDEDVLSTDDFIHSRDVMAVSVGLHKDAQVFNLNDGASIARTIPLRMEDAVIETAPESKAAALAAIRTAFTTDYGDDLSQNLEDLLEQLDAVIADLRGILPVDIPHKLAAVDGLGEMHRYFYADMHKSAQVFPLLRGSMLHMGRFTYDCISRIKDEKKACEFARYAYGLYERFLQAARENVTSLKNVADERRARKEKKHV